MNTRSNSQTRRWLLYNRPSRVLKVHFLHIGGTYHNSPQNLHYRLRLLGSDSVFLLRWFGVIKNVHRFLLLPTTPALRVLKGIGKASLSSSSPSSSNITLNSFILPFSIPSSLIPLVFGLIISACPIPISCPDPDSLSSSSSYIRV